MKRFSLCLLLALFYSLPAFSQFWIHVEWGAPHCRHCEWMEEALHLHPHEAAEYHRIIHKYGQRIEKEARREYRHWDKAARKIYELRMERDHLLLHLLSPSQFSLYVRLMRDYPQRVHDYKGWYANPKHPHLKPSYDCRRYENDYWNHHWADMRPDKFFQEKPRPEWKEKPRSQWKEKPGAPHQWEKSNGRGQGKPEGLRSGKGQPKKEQKENVRPKRSEERVKANRSEKH